MSMQRLARTLHRHPNSYSLIKGYSGGIRPRNSAMSTGAAETDTQAANNASASGITPTSLQIALKERLDAQYVDVEDLSGGCGQAFNAMIVSPQFEKKTTLARHRLVNSALKSEIAAIHAWTPKCFTPEEWEKKQAQERSADA
ncbi:MAG: hypothetical protein Q9190_001203 [Brigantiaea leucoxantha]